MNSLQPLILSIAVLGVAIYGLTRAIKPLLAARWGRDTQLGRFTVLLLPLGLGCLFAGFGINHLAGYLSLLLGYETSVSAPWGARVLMGLFSGTLATQIHNIVKGRIKTVQPKGDSSEK
jgi:hypothetical protein